MAESYYDETLTLDQATTKLRHLLKEMPFSDWHQEVKKIPVVENGKLSFKEPVEADGDLIEYVRQSRSQAVQIAAMLSQFANGCVGRNFLRLGFIYNANAPRSGKTLLVKLAVMPVNGNMRTQGWNAKDEELRKVLDAEVLRAATYIVFDNVRGHVMSQVLEAFMTTTTWTGRVLGASQMFEAVNEATVFITGNECTVSPDIANRCLLVDLFVTEADVQSRVIEDEFDDAWLMEWENRRMILSCLWAIVRHWDAAGRPVAQVTVRKGFERWCRALASMVAYAGFGDCLAEPVGVESVGDTEGADMRALVGCMAEYFAGNDKKTLEFEFHEIVSLCREHGLFEWIIEGKEVTEEGEKKFQIKPESNSRFGKLLRRYAPMKEARVFRLTPTSSVLLSCSGKDRQRRYMLRTT